jgi:hypothetical protein
MLLCDRTRHRYHVLAPTALPWLEFCSAYSRQTARIRQALNVIGTKPDRWYVSTMPVKARLG